MIVPLLSIERYLLIGSASRPDFAIKTASTFVNLGFEVQCKKNNLFLMYMYMWRGEGLINF